MDIHGRLADSIQRLNEMINKRYGCAVDFLSAESAHHIISVDSHTTFEEFKRGETVLANNTALIPFFVNNVFSGAARVAQPEKIKYPEREYLFQIISLVIENRLTNFEGIENLSVLSHEVLSEQAPIRLLHSNVIPLTRFKKNVFPITNKFENSPSLNFSFLIESQNPEDIFKMALEIHDRTQRLIFLPIEDLDPTTFDSHEALNNLGPITIFIRDITEAPHLLQRKLIRYFEAARDKSSPQFITGSRHSLESLRNDIRVFNELLPSLSVGYLRLTQPFSYYRREKLLDFFYDSLTGRPTV